MYFMKVGCHALHSQNGNEKSSVIVMLDPKG